MRISLLEASHWLTRLYLDALEATGLKVVAISDAENVKGAEIAPRFESKLYKTYQDWLAKEAIDFAFVFRRRFSMSAMAEALIERKIPFALAKPCGVRTECLADAADVSGLLRRRSGVGGGICVGAARRGTAMRAIHPIAMSVS